jgi:hypothetical protein
MSRAIDLRTLDSHPLVSVGTLVLNLRCTAASRQGAVVASDNGLLYLATIDRRQPRDVDGDPSSFLVREHLSGLSTVEIRERLTIGIPGDVAAGHRVGVPGAESGVTVPSSRDRLPAGRGDM